MREDLIQRYDMAVPRYTSYPTAPHFSPAVNGETYAHWLAALDSAAPLSLYLHIAYCAEMCWFCGCHTKATRKYAPVADYLDALLEEARLVARALPACMRLDHIHFGGGSPTLLTPADFGRTLAHLREHYNVTLDAEIAVELDPRTADEAYVAAMARAGVTRASIGVQDFDARVQKAINRIQPHDVTARVICWLRAHGVTAINMDLCYGLPFQTVTSLLDTVDKAAALRPSRIALFGYAHVPWMKPHQKLIPEASLPGIEQRWEQYEAAAARLAAHGYVTIGLDHFALPDDAMAKAQAARALHRNFQGYTTDEAPVLIGLGASAIGALPQGYAANEIAIDRYKETVREGRLPVTRGIAVTGEDRLRRAIIERLMCDMSVDLEEIALMHDVEAESFDADLSRLAPLEADGIVMRTGRRLELTEQGRPLVRAVCAVFDEYLGKGAARHSKAV